MQDEEELTINAQAIAFKAPVTVLLTLMIGVVFAVAVGTAELEDAVVVVD